MFYQEQFYILIIETRNHAIFYTVFLIQYFIFILFNFWKYSKDCFDTLNRYVAA